MQKNYHFQRQQKWSTTKMYMPPILPVITDPILAENFDSEFTEMDFSSTTTTTTSSSSNNYITTSTTNTIIFQW